MKERNERKTAAENKALEDGMDYILETIVTPDFVEVIGKMGGDAVTIRYYNDGSSAER